MGPVKLLPGSGKTAIFLALVGGFARLVDLGGVYSPPQAIEPAAAMRADWLRVGDDFRAAIDASADLLPADESPAADLVEA